MAISAYMFIEEFRRKFLEERFCGIPSFQEKYYRQFEHGLLYLQKAMVWIILSYFQLREKYTYLEFFWSLYLAFGLNTDQKNSEYKHFLCSVHQCSSIPPNDIWKHFFQGILLLQINQELIVEVKTFLSAIKRFFRSLKNDKIIGMVFYLALFFPFYFAEFACLCIIFDSKLFNFLIPIFAMNSSMLL